MKLKQMMLVAAMSMLVANGAMGFNPPWTLTTRSVTNSNLIVSSAADIPGVAEKLRTEAALNNSPRFVGITIRGAGINSLRDSNIAFTKVSGNNTFIYHLLPNTSTQDQSVFIQAINGVRSKVGIDGKIDREALAKLTKGQVFLGAEASEYIGIKACNDLLAQGKISSYYTPSNKSAVVYDYSKDSYKGYSTKIGSSQTVDFQGSPQDFPAVDEAVLRLNN